MPLRYVRGTATLLAGWVALRRRHLTITLRCTETWTAQTKPRCLAFLAHDLVFVLVYICLIVPEQSVPATLL